MQLRFLEETEPELARCCRMLAVLVEDDRMPLETAARLWGVGEAAAATTARRLAGQHLAKLEDGALCFSLVAPGRTLDLQADSARRTFAEHSRTSNTMHFTAFYA